MASTPRGAETWRPFILDAHCCAPRATYPGGGPETAPRVASLAAPIRFCSRCGLPCRLRYRKRGGLLPHPFTLTRPSPKAKAGGLLSVALSLGSPPPDVIRHRVSMEPGLSSRTAFRLSLVRPPGRLAGAIKAFAAKNATTNPQIVDSNLVEAAGQPQL